MATLAPTSPPSSPSYNRRRKGFIRKCERYCCNTITYFPLLFVYGLTSWAIWVEVNMGMGQASWLGYFFTLLGVVLYILLNWSYTTAVFTDPGSPLTSAPGYSSLPTSEPTAYNSLTVKSSGDMRFCKKCQSKKPDRAHHCSTCKRCVLKMDHHCPWLATCVGLRNYKAFLLFLLYVSLFCWVCFAVSARWIWKVIIIEGSVEESLMPVNYILLSVLSGIIGLVISGFTGWHVYLTANGRTTIESLEKTRYLSPLKAQMQSHLNPRRTYVDTENHTLGEQLRDIGDRLTEIHANALPGVLRPEEGEERMSPAQSSLRQAYDWDFQERQRERDRYNDYLDEQDNEKMPNAFDLGWRKNMTMVMGREPWLWWLPICNSLGDGWTWEPSQEWKDAAEKIWRRREEEMTTQMRSERNAGWALESPTKGIHDRHQVSREGWRADGAATQMQNLRPSDESDDYDSSSDEEQANSRAKLLRRQQEPPHPGAKVPENWNDIPDDMMTGRRRSPRGISRRGR